MGRYVPRPLAVANPTLVPVAPDVPRALRPRIPLTRGSRGRTWRAPSPQWSRPWRAPPPFGGGRVTRSQTRAGIAGLVAPLEHDRPRRAPVSPIHRAKTWWTYLVDSGRVDALYKNDWGCVVNTIPRGLQAQWIEVLTTTLQWIFDENDRRRAAALWLFRAVAPMILRNGAGKARPARASFPDPRARSKPSSAAIGRSYGRTSRPSPRRTSGDVRRRRTPPPLLGLVRVILSNENGVREGDFGGFTLFAHTILGGQKFRVDGVLRVCKVCKSRNGFPNCFETEESNILNYYLGQLMGEKYPSNCKT